MADYTTVNSTFWTGETGRKLREAGPEAQLVALYLLSNSHRNPLGIYYLPKLLISHETALDAKGASKGLQRGIQSSFCAYDDHSEVVWVFKMATYQIGDSLKLGDKRVKWVNDLYASLPNNQFLHAFWEEYGAKYHIEKRRGIEGAWKGLQCPIEANSNSNSNSNSNREGRPAASPRPRRCAVPENFKLTEDMIAYAKSHGINGNVDLVFDHFIENHKAKGTVHLDWKAAWRTWVMREIQFSKPKYQQPYDLEAESAKARKLALGE
jgi:hypothetical protein